MNARRLEPRLSEDLKETVGRGLASGQLKDAQQVARHTGLSSNDEEFATTTSAESARFDAPPCAADGSH